MVSRGARTARDDVLEEVYRRCNVEGEGLKLVIVGGVAYLDGNVASYQQKKAVAAAVAGLPNVRRVVNRLRVVPGGPRNDRQIAQGVLQALNDDPLIGLQAMEVKVVDGVVLLSGRVSSLASRIAAESVAWSISGVRHIINRLEVASPKKARDAQAVSLAIKRGLQSCLGLEPSSFQVAFRQGAVYLRGTVPSSYHRSAAEEMARWHPLIREVVNQLQVRASQPLSKYPPSA